MSATAAPTGKPPVPPETAWFLTDGTPYAGADFRDAKGKAFGEGDLPCGKCGGSGKRRFGRRRFAKCPECGGAKTTFEQFRIYTAAEIDRKDARRAAARSAVSTRARAREAAAGARWAAWGEENAALLDRAREADDPWINDVLAKGEIYGHVTEAQVRAIGDKLRELDAERRACIGSRPVGTPGERMDLDVTCRRRGSFMARGFGRRRGSREVFVTEMVDSSGNALIAISEAFKLSKGDRARVRGTVKTHDEDRKAWPVTVLTRVAVLKLDPAPPEDPDAPREAFDAGDDVPPLPPLAPGEAVACIDHGEGMNLPF